MQSYLLGIDQGTTGTTVLAFNERGKLCGRGYQPFKQYYPKPGWVEHDGEEIWQSLKQALRKLFTSSKISSKQIKGIGITNQRETTLIWDSKTGKPLHRAIVWQCRRTTPIMESLKKKGVAAWVHRHTGLTLDPYFSGSKIQWLLKHDPSLRRKAKQGRAKFGTVDSFLLWRLTGGKVHATDWTNASRTMIFNINTKQWDKRLLKLFNIPRSLLPEALPSNSNFGKTKNLSFLPDGIPITGILGDQQAALYGQGCYRSGEGKNTYGTGSFFMVQLGARPIYSKKGFLTTLAVDGNGKSSYALEGSVFIAGAAIQWIRDELKWIRKSSDTEKIARQYRRRHPDTHVYLVPAFVGLGAPYWNSQARGAFVGLTRGTSQDELITATLESLAYPIAELTEIFEKETKRRIQCLKVDGGASQNDYLMQLQADLLGRSIIRPQLVEATAWGAVKLAGASLGFWKNKKSLNQVRYRKFTPRYSLGRHRTALAGWKNAVGRVL